MIDTTNKFVVAAAGERIVILNPPYLDMTHDDALNLAAYLVSMAYKSKYKFADILERIQS